MTSSTFWIRRFPSAISNTWTIRMSSGLAPLMELYICQVLSVWTTLRQTTTVTLYCSRWCTSVQCVTTFCAKRVMPKLRGHPEIRYSIWFSDLASWCVRFGIHEILRRTFHRMKCFSRSSCGVLSSSKLLNKVWSILLVVLEIELILIDFRWSHWLFVVVLAHNSSRIAWKQTSGFVDHL